MNISKNDCADLDSLAVKTHFWKTFLFVIGGVFLVIVTIFLTTKIVVKSASTFLSLFSYADSFLALSASLLMMSFYYIDIVKHDTAIQQFRNRHH